MLNWSFANNLSLLDWTDADFKDYVATVQIPDSGSASPSIQPRFLVSPGKDYHDYPINVANGWKAIPKWLRGSLAAGIFPDFRPLASRCQR